MANPWLDEEKARAWQPKPRAGAALRDEHVEVVLALCAVHAPRRILDLGCGVGDIDVRVLERFPEASLVCLDGSPVMLDRCRETLAPYGGRAAFVECDLAEDWRAAVAGGFDVVMSFQAIHHLESEAKRACYGRAHDVLAAGGLFVLQERVAVEPRLWAHTLALWQARRAEMALEPLALEMDFATWLAAERAGGDFPDPLDVQLAWLRGLGFDPVASFAGLADRVVFGGIR